MYLKRNDGTLFRPLCGDPAERGPPVEAGRTPQSPAGEAPDDAAAAIQGAPAAQRC